MRSADTTSDLAQQLRPAILTLRIIVVALATGVAAFAVAAIVMRMRQAQAPAIEAAGLLAILGIAAAPVAFLLSRFVPGVFVANARGQIASGQFGLPAESNANQSNPNQTSGLQSSLVQLGDDGKLFTVYQTKTIISAALLDGAAFLNIIAFLLGGSPTALGLALLLTLAIVAMFPRTRQVVEWIESQRRLMDEEKLLAR